MGKKVGFIENIHLIYDIINNSVIKSKKDPHEALIAIVFSCMSLEAFFNLILEIIFRYQGFSDTPKKLISFPKEIKKLEKKNSGIKAKYKKTLSFFTKELIEEDKSPYKDFSCLIDIRNKLIHPHPEEIELISGTLVNENHNIY
jgi:hypothetical protein